MSALLGVNVYSSESRRHVLPGVDGYICVCIVGSVGYELLKVDVII